MVSQAGQWRQLLLIEFQHAFIHVMREHGVEDSLLLVLLNCVPISTSGPAHVVGPYRNFAFKCPLLNPTMQRAVLLEKRHAGGRAGSAAGLVCGDSHREKRGLRVASRLACSAAV